ncbi:nucleotidyltransferase domain-containing protein [Streptomyces sp. NRRL F-5123]|uniref:nucleotidyltransferase domain-containing protein n=1 Tax=Streptomyces sp. NRRL F-5123 TaxID=1463856 RepID=UPI001902AD02|nr:nucleotidyltransferase domain-containing protein [Streptomyces sp. NRRL F-5123]
MEGVEGSEGARRTAGARGLGPDGTILREGSLARVQPEYVPLLDSVRARVPAVFPGGRLHSAYVYGSIPRGTARTGISDLDLVVVLHQPPSAADRAAGDALSRALDREFAVIDGVGLLLFDAGTLLSELERYDLGFFVACLCTPVLGEDLADSLPRYRPDGLLARETNGDLALALPGWADRFSAASSGPERRVLCRGAARRVVRTGFTLVMPRWGGWTSSLREQAAVFAAYYPARGEDMHRAASMALSPSEAPSDLAFLIEELAPWLASTYVSVHGEKAPRGAS